ncbi:MAG: tyrosine--tRNA ligase [bacterium]|nr:tyrosine--tRNA ligase [bacterium]
MSENIDAKINAVLRRGVAEFIDPEGKFSEKLMKKVRGEYEGDIVIKHGVDPTRPDIHLGHAVVLRKLRAFQELGCKVIFLIGDYTTQIGDPTGKSKVRPELEQKEIEENMKTYVDQVGKILLTDKKVFSWIRNSDWFTAITDLGFPSGHTVSLNINQDGKQVTINYDANSFPGKAAVFEKTRMQAKENPDKGVAVITLRGFLWTLRRVSHSRLIARDMFQERINKGEELYMHEMMYPVLQGIDSYVLSKIYGSCDLEIGGTDQTFNMLFGRDVMKINGVAEQAVMTVPLLSGISGDEKMSKSADNYIAITDSPEDMYGKTMSLPDSSIVSYFALTTYASDEEREEIKVKLEKGSVNPKEIKMRLAREIVASYHGEEKAEGAEKAFEETFRAGKMPENAPETVAQNGSSLADILIASGTVESKTEFRRLIEKGAISVVGGEKLPPDPKITVTNDMDIRVGKHRFIRIKVK